VRQQNVASHAAAEPHQQRHQQHAHNSEVLVVIGAPRQQRAIQRIGRCGDQIDGCEVASELEAAEVDRGCGEDPHNRGS
jgi:hypothetical protein